MSGTKFNLSNTVQHIAGMCICRVSSSHFPYMMSSLDFRSAGSSVHKLDISSASSGIHKPRTVKRCS